MRGSQLQGFQFFMGRLIWAWYHERSKTQSNRAATLAGRLLCLLGVLVLLLSATAPAPMRSLLQRLQAVLAGLGASAPSAASVA